MVAVGLLVAVSVALLALEPVHGAVLLVFTPQHGFDSGDLLAAPFLVLAVVLLLSPASPVVHAWDAAARTRAEPRRRGSGALVPFGVGLVVLGTLDRIWPSVHPSDTLELVVSLATMGAATVTALVLASRSVPRVDRALLLAAVGTFVAGSLLDTLAQPKGTVLGPTLLAGFLVWSARGRARALVAVGLAMLVVVDSLALWSIHESDTVLAVRGGGGTRTIALGVVLLLEGLTWFVTARRHVDVSDLMHAA